MKKHPFFDLLLPDISDLVFILDNPLSSRTVLREWPLSSVETLVSENGAKYILKSVRFPCTQELSFYQAVESHHTPNVTPVLISKFHASFLYPFKEGIHPKDLAHSHEGFQQMAQDIHSWIERLPLTLPVYLDISTPFNWNKWTIKFLVDFLAFLNLTEVSNCNKNDYLILNRIINKPSLMEFALTDTCYTHGDFSQDNILILPKGDFFVLDWQRSLITSPLVDHVSFLESLNIDPLQSLPAESVILTNFLKINWLLDCSLNWFPPGVLTYDQQIKQLISRIKSLLKAF